MSISLILGKPPKQWVVTKEIVASVYEGRSIDNKQHVAIKIEERDGRTRSKLKREKTFFDKLSKGGLADGFPNVHYFEIGEDYNIMVLDKFGPTLAFLFQFCDGQFSLKTVIELVDQLLYRIEFIHSKGIIYGDINPNNFLMQSDDGLGIVNVVSFGLARTYLDDKGDHVHLDLQRSFGGSLNFASRNAHLKRTLSRRDDLESLGYFMVYLLKGTLPWCNTKAVNTRDLRNIIGKTKLKTNFKDLCKHLPGADTFMAYFNYVENLDFEDKPDYEKMRKLFRSLAAEYNIQFDGKYDWVVHNYKAHYLQLSIPKFMLIAAKKKRGLMDKQFVAREQKRMMDLIALDERSRIMDGDNKKKNKDEEFEK